MAKTKGIQLRGGAILLTRLGSLNFKSQEMWSHRAPASKGLWAFPWPHFDMFFAHHQYDQYLPKALRYKRDDELQRNFPGSLTAYSLENGGPLPSTVKFADLYDENGYLNDEFAVRGEWWEARDAWIKNVAPKVVPLKKFWYSGDLYTHFTHQGEIGATGYMAAIEWSRMDARTYGEHLIRSYPGKTWERWRPEDRPFVMDTSIDHMEVFIPKGAGKIT